MNAPPNIVRSLRSTLRISSPIIIEFLLSFHENLGFWNLPVWVLVSFERLTISTSPLSDFRSIPTSSFFVCR
jgi:hypothetical protein